MKHWTTFAVDQDAPILCSSFFTHKPIRNPKLNNSTYTIKRASWKAKGVTRKKNGAGSVLLFTKDYAYRSYRSQKPRRLIGLKKLGSTSVSFLYTKKNALRPPRRENGKA